MPRTRENRTICRCKENLTAVRCCIPNGMTGFLPVVGRGPLPDLLPPCPDRRALIQTLTFPLCDCQVQMLVFQGRRDWRSAPAVDGRLQGGEMLAAFITLPISVHEPVHNRVARRSRRARRRPKQLSLRSASHTTAGFSCWAAFTVRGQVDERRASVWELIFVGDERIAHV